MKLTGVKTQKVVKGDDLFKILDQYLPEKLEEKSIVVITSKIVGICEGRLVKVEGTDKDALVKKEADYYIPKEENKYQIYLTIKNNIMAATSGIDESNGNGYYILWPKDPQKSANKIRAYLLKKYKLKYLGVIITDSKTVPMLRGVVGMAIAHSGFLALRNYIGKPDIFGRNLLVTRANVSDGLAGASVTLMGEGNETMPIAIIEDVPFVQFQKRDPSESELKKLRIPLKEDIFAGILSYAKWKKGGS
jgi:dihydrofolate synthase / folylpolyglutamate synthase